MSAWSYVRGSNQNLKISKNYLGVYLSTHMERQLKHIQQQRIKSNCWNLKLEGFN